MEPGDFEDKQEYKSRSKIVYFLLVRNSEAITIRSSSVPVFENCVLFFEILLIMSKHY